MELVKVYTARDDAQAIRLSQRLEQHGIRSAISGEDASASAAHLPGVAVTAPALWVASENAERARMILEDLDRVQPPMPQPPRPAWTCANCGEVVDSNFEICWSCGHPPQSISDRPAIRKPWRTGRLCIRCNYDLRGLPLSGRCPECGLPILRSLLDAALSGTEEESPILAELTSGALAPVAARIEVPVSACVFVACAWVRAWETLNPDTCKTLQVPRTPVTARALIQAARSYAVEYFGSEREARLILDGWNLKRSEDLGRVARALVEAAVIEEGPRCRLQDFSPLPWPIEPAPERAVRGAEPLVWMILLGIQVIAIALVLLRACTDK